MKLAGILFLILWSGCSTGNNELMTKFINKRKSFQDSLTMNKNRVKDYAFRRIYDSAQKALDAGIFYEEKIKSLSFSIDSLSRMK